MKPRHRAAVAPAAILIFLLLVPAASASNMAYWVRVTLASGGASAGVYWVSLPYAYTPPDLNANSVVDAQDLVEDLQPPTLTRPCVATDCDIAAVIRWDFATGEYQTWDVDSPSGEPFTLEPGVAYGLVVRDVAGHTSHDLDLFGLHDPSFAFSQCHSPGGVNMHWISLPPHLALDTSRGVPGVLDAEDLGQAMGGPSKVFMLRRLDEVTGRWESWVVGSVWGTPFELDLSRGVAVDLSCADLQAACSQCQWSWTPPHY